ncbi:MAG: hypothetical protein ABWX96_16875 [Propionibacteriaceae bacterium]
MTDDELRDALVWLYAEDCGLVCSADSEPALRQQARRAVWDRLVADEGQLRVWISQLVRDVFLSDLALASGHGIDDACEFWSWFDQAMWSSGPTPRRAETAGRRLTG